MTLSLAAFVKTKRKEANLTQQEFADRAGVALTVVRKIEQGKENLSLVKVNQVLMMFGHKLAPVNHKAIEPPQTQGLAQIQSLGGQKDQFTHKFLDKLK